MIKEYKTISEVAGPLMLVKNVNDVTYDELGEIILPSGENDSARFLKSTEAMPWYSSLRVPPAST